MASVLGRVLTSSASALLKHEVCYVLGQIQEQGASGGAGDALRATLEDTGEHPMVRHEVGRCRLTVPKPELKARLVSALEP